MPRLGSPTGNLERFQAKWSPVRVKKTRKIKNMELRFDSIETEKALVGAGQPPHGEFDVAIRQFAPDFNPAHIGGLGIAGEEIARLGPRLVARQRKGLAQIAIVRFPPAGHPVCQIARARDHVATPGTHNDPLNIAPAGTNPSPFSLPRRWN